MCYVKIYHPNEVTASSLTHATTDRSSTSSSGPSKLMPPPLPQSMPPPPPSPVCPPPPPPLPVPPPSSPQIVTNQTASICQAIHQPWSEGEVATKTYPRVVNLFRKTTEDTSEQEDHVYLSMYKPCAPVIQEGPRCGLVALAMASDVLQQTLDPDMIYKKAKCLGFTKQGEMFSVADMGHLCKEMANHDVLLINPQNQWDILLSSLLRGQPVLFPYDADRNHQPCLKQGRKAHWAVLTGIFWRVDRRLLDKLQESDDFLITQQVSYRDLFLIKCLTTSSVDKILTICDKDSDLWIYGHHGKSRHPAIWQLSDLLASNGNLTEIEPDKAANADEWVFPKGGLSVGLKDQALVLKPQALP